MEDDLQEKSVNWSSHNRSMVCNYDKLSNEELQKIVADKLPTMRLHPVGDHNRHTVIALLKISGGLFPE